MIELDRVEVNAIIAFLEQSIRFYDITIKTVNPNDTYGVIMGLKLNRMGVIMMLDLLENRLQESTNE